MTRTASFEVITNSAGIDAVPFECNPAQWHQAVGVARQACARIFRDGGSAADAVRTFGLERIGSGSLDWSRAVALIAESLCTAGLKRAA